MASIQIRSVIITENGVETSDDMFAGLHRQLDQWLTEYEALTIIATEKLKTIQERDDS